MNSTIVAMAADGPNAALPITGLVLGGLVIITVIVQLFSLARAKARAMQNEEYMKLAAKLGEDQAAIVADLKHIKTDVKAAAERTKNIERILQDVE